MRATVALLCLGGLLNACIAKSLVHPPKPAARGTTASALPPSANGTLKNPVSEGTDVLLGTGSGSTVALAWDEGPSGVVPAPEMGYSDGDPADVGGLSAEAFLAQYGFSLPEGAAAGGSLDPRLYGILLPNGTRFFPAGYGPPPEAALLPEATDVTLNQQEVMLAPGKTTTLAAVVHLTNGSYNTEVVWSSSNTAIAQVSETGKVTAAAKGIAYVTAAATANTGLTAVCSVYVGKIVKLPDGRHSVFYQ